MRSVLLLFYGVMLLEVMDLLPNIPCAIHSIPIISRAIATMKFNKTIPNNGDAKTITDIATANMPTPKDNDLELFDMCLDDAPSIIFAIPANNRPIPSKMTKNPVAYSGKARTPTLTPITKPPRMKFPTREDFSWFGEKPLTTLSIPMTISAAARTTDIVATPTLGYIITDSANPTAITPRPTCKNLSHDGDRLLNFLSTSISVMRVTVI